MTSRSQGLTRKRGRETTKLGGLFDLHRQPAYHLPIHSSKPFPPMKLLLLDPLAQPLIHQIRAVSDDVEVLAPGADDVGELLPQADIVCGSLTTEQFATTSNLRWIHSGGAGVDGLLSPALVASDVTLTSAKGYVGEHLAEHAMALLLAVTRGIGTAVRARNWDVKWPMRDNSWELTDRTLGIIGLRRPDNLDSVEQTFHLGPSQSFILQQSLCNSVEFI